jgi:hypothetical protein
LKAHSGQGGEKCLKELEQLSSEVPSAWVDMLGLSLWVKTRQSQLTEYSDKILAVARPCLAIEIVSMPLAAIPRGASHGGCAPDVPLDWKWLPKKHVFLLRLDLRDMAPSPVSRHLPRDGWLLFFGGS